MYAYSRATFCLRALFFPPFIALQYTILKFKQAATLTRNREQSFVLLATTQDGKQD